MNNTIDWATVVNTFISTLPAILIALGTLLAALRTSRQVGEIGRKQDEVKKTLDAKEEEIKNANGNGSNPAGGTAQLSGMYGYGPCAG